MYGSFFITPHLFLLAMLSLGLFSQPAISQSKMNGMSADQVVNFCADWPDRRAEIASTDFDDSFKNYGLAMEKMQDMTERLSEMDDEAFLSAVGQWTDRALSLTRIVANSASIYKGNITGSADQVEAQMIKVIGGLSTAGQLSIAGMQGDGKGAAWTLSLNQAKQLTPWAAIAGVVKDVHSTIKRDQNWSESREHLRGLIGRAEKELKKANRARKTSSLETLNAALQEFDGICNAVIPNVEPCIQIDKGEASDGRSIYRAMNTCDFEIFAAYCVEADLPNAKGCGENESTWFTYGRTLKPGQEMDNMFNLHALGPLRFAACPGNRFKVKYDGVGGYYCTK
ncbi:hypothetical protein MHM88_12420 [Epibacterium sp. MM17-32]|uniref:hypothetical protein n=1 Tax=Epibacterium sp. MM17-32 TaxID=2917734 RepID=UPI001EF5F8EF|nr:hypothetical protein [Epibacterium sp. MM17-32]MCG7628613.1 hypothetical protein [Epibacterium sp. MM17-32]